jgi:hypothetical protein
LWAHGAGFEFYACDQSDGADVDDVRFAALAVRGIRPIGTQFIGFVEQPLIAVEIERREPRSTG